MRKVSSKKIYEGLNFDSLIRGPKQKSILLPTSLSDNFEFKSGSSCLIAEGVSVGSGAVLRRSIVGAGCKIGKNVELFNSILLEGV